MSWSMSFSGFKGDIVAKLRTEIVVIAAKEKWCVEQLTRIYNQIVLSLDAFVEHAHASLSVSGHGASVSVNASHYTPQPIEPQADAQVVQVASQDNQPKEA
jgi:hypothetical protein